MMKSNRYALMGLITALLAGHPILAGTLANSFSVDPVQTTPVVVSGASQTTDNALVSTNLGTSVPVIQVVRPSDPTGLAKPLPASVRGGTLSVPVQFSSQSWGRTGDVSTTACPAPKDRSYRGPVASEIRLLDRNGKLLRTRIIGNPRLNLVENPRKQSGLAERVEMVLQVGFETEAETLEFWEDPAKQRQPSLVVDVANAMDTSLIIEGFRPKANGCQLMDPLFVQIGDSGRFVLPHALKRAADVSGVSVKEIVADMVRNGGKVDPKLELPAAVVQLIDRATVGR
ncbi:hypothetical protein MK489_02500 [Myxococcota bacterium]|nr:hypothetical protein [Myxococcota bacterium]